MHTTELRLLDTILETIVYAESKQAQVEGSGKPSRAVEGELGGTMFGIQDVRVGTFVLRRSDSLGVSLRQTSNWKATQWRSD